MVRDDKTWSSSCKVPRHVAIEEAENKCVIGTTRLERSRGVVRREEAGILLRSKSRGQQSVMANRDERIE